MYRLIFFLSALVIPAVFSWWLFIPIAIIFVFLAKMPVELVLAGFMLDMIYYFGEGFIYSHLLTVFSASLIVIAFFLNKVIRWPKMI